jgi:ABC-type glycerol-3-phosphate transport system substrate-binding protein
MKREEGGKMKKRIVLFLMVTMMILSACGTNEENDFTTVLAKHCYGSAGYTELIAGAEKSAVYNFTAENSADVEWSVYVLDEAFEDGYRYIAQFTEPVLIGDGIISVDAGQYVYVYCSVNEFTAEVADENAKLNITVK